MPIQLPHVFQKPLNPVRRLDALLCCRKFFHLPFHFGLCLLNTVIHPVNLSLEFFIIFIIIIIQKIQVIQVFPQFSLFHLL